MHLLELGEANVIGVNWIYSAAPPQDVPRRVRGQPLEVLRLVEQQPLSAPHLCAKHNRHLEYTSASYISTRYATLQPACDLLSCMLVVP